MSKVCSECGAPVEAGRYSVMPPDLCPNCLRRELQPQEPKEDVEPVTCAWCREELQLPIDPRVSYGCCADHRQKLIEQALADRFPSKRPDQWIFSFAVVLGLILITLLGFGFGAIVATWRFMR